MNLHEEPVFDLCRLPTEVLCHIFIHLPQTDYMLPPNSKSPPMLLTRICRRWREVALDMPSLWCRLTMKIDYWNWRQAVFCYDSWLKRAQGRPLSLEITRIKNDTTDLRTLLQPYTSQIFSLKVEFDSASLRAVAPEILLSDLPALQELQVVIHALFKTRDTLSPVLTAISRLFTLRSLNFEALDCHAIERLSHLNLTNIDLYKSNPTNIINLLQKFPTLSSLKIEMLVDDGLPCEPFTHSTIQLLSIQGNVRGPFHPAVPLVRLFNALTLPNLRVLRVEGGSWPCVEDLISHYRHVVK
ncbi:uncharacterized protein HD556DRAFT_161822 [Suillus plorans]|uniref:F-box domain-containing protein n=1 Tax=Suillus plorans TaxID=116603 RepID=A0A9P7J0R4_9AGAM|nr:uncharacterized protein HD556DRAFT_161822 [Suillus plorans]KAG1798935.1 hypothetical protein HD556DRAFT_161822 [Suillus plorans]